MEKTCHFSIITVCLNAREGVIQTAQSLMEQKFQDFEWIVIDGGSQDGTIEFLANNSRVTYYLSEIDNGIYDAMNKGIKVAKGEYCLFLNAGDYLRNSDVLRNVVAEDPRSDLIVGQMHVVAIPGSKKMSKTKRYDDKDINSNEFLYYRSLPHQATFIRRSVFERFGEYDTFYKIMGDHDFFTRIIKQGATLSFTETCISVFPLDGMSYELKGSLRSRQEFAFFRKRHFTFFFRFKRLVNDLIKNYNQII